MPRAIVILEDNRERCEEMRRCVAARFPSFEFRPYTGVAELVEHLRDHLEEAICISLDHDLELVPDGKGRFVDPGTGRQAADYLATRRPQCPVIIHSTNTAAAQGMEVALQEAGWDVTRVAPWGDLEWVAAEWLRALRKKLGRSAREASRRPGMP